jgi:hypothetical protein
MRAAELRALLGLVTRLDDLVLNEIASLPNGMMKDFTDLAIVAVARGEMQWRQECLK